MRIIDIDDPNDSRLDHLRDLNHPTKRPDLPGGPGVVVAEGSYVVGRMVLSKFHPHLLLGTESRRQALERTAREEGWDLDDRLAEIGDPPFYRVSSRTLSAVIGFTSSRDIVAAAHKAPELSLAETLDGARTVVILEGVNDPENIGAIFRGVAAFGADAVLFGASTGDPLYRRVVRVSMGHVLRVPFCRLDGTTTTWQRQLDQLHEAGWTTVALTPRADRSIAAALEGNNGKVALVVGAEGPGLTEHAMRACTLRAAIPMAPGTDSLNVATATTVGLYERFRTR